MIFKIHYFSFNAGLSGVLVLITVFLRKYSDASSTEVGTLLMVLPFVAVFTKPFFCALADRHRKYREYFILALLFTLLGFGSYTLLPFFPAFIEANGRACWYLLVAATIVGYIAYGVVWSLGDAYAANVAHRTGESFGMIRLWGTIGWGVAGACVGALSPYLQLPEMVLGFLIFIITHTFEILLLLWWPNARDFEMGDGVPADAHGNEAPLGAAKLATITEKPAQGGGGAGAGEAGRGEFVAIQLGAQPAGALEVCRTASNSLTITARLELSPQGRVEAQTLPGGAGQESLGNERKLAEVELVHGAQNQSAAEAAEVERRKIADLQMTIFKMVALRHKSLLKYLALFTALGAVYNAHWSYFFLHLDRLAAEGAADFSTLVGLCLVAQAIGETLCFAIAPQVVRALGRDGAISLNAAAYALRYYGNGLGIPMVSPYVAIVTESLQGINYGIFYYLITDTALHYALLVDEVIPELKARGLLEVSSAGQLNAVKTSLRATMQGVFSGAFDGLGFGLGSLAAGLVLERHSYEQLWCYAGAAALLIFLLHAAYELLARCLRKRRAHSYKHQIAQINRREAPRALKAP